VFSYEDAKSLFCALGESCLLRWSIDHITEVVRRRRRWSMAWTPARGCTSYASLRRTGPTDTSRHRTPDGRHPCTPRAAAGENRRDAVEISVQSKMDRFPSMQSGAILTAFTFQTLVALRTSAGRRLTVSASSTASAALSSSLSHERVLERVTYRIIERNFYVTRVTYNK